MTDSTTPPYIFRPIDYHVPHDLLPYSSVEAVNRRELMPSTGDEHDQWMVFSFSRHSRAYMRTDAVLEELPCHNTTNAHLFDSAEEAFDAIVRWHDNPQTIECPCEWRPEEELCRSCERRGNRDAK